MYERFGDDAEDMLFGRGPPDVKRGREKKWKDEVAPEDPDGEGGHDGDGEDAAGEAEDLAHPDSEPDYHSEDEDLPDEAGDPDAPALAGDPPGADDVAADALGMDIVALVVVDPPAPPEPVRAPLPDHYIYAVPGGELRFYTKTKRFAAFCDCTDNHGRRCRRERKVSLAVARGRPLGYLLAWLRLGHTWATNREHMDLGAFIAHQERVDSRAWFEAQPNVGHFLAGEEPAPDGAPREPLENA